MAVKIYKLKRNFINMHWEQLVEESYIILSLHGV
jgi:hypothetical protein